MERVIENNKLIDDFMNQMPVGDIKYDYHQDWNALIPVVEKIESLKVETIELEDDIYDDREVTYVFSVEIQNNICMINRDVLPQYYGTEQDFLSTYSGISELTKIEAVYETIIKFIEWYNELLSTDKTKTV